MTAGPAIAPPVTGPATETPRRSSRGWWVAAGLVILPTFLAPISLTWQVVTKGTGPTVPASRLIELAANTLALAAAVTATALAIGTLTAWLTTRTDLPGRRAWRIAAALPLVIPSYVAALTIIGATGPAGLVSRWLGVTVAIPYGFVGAWIALSVFLAPMAHLIVTPALGLIDPATEEAANGLGASRSRVFFTITLPQLRPALVSAGLMTGLYTISDFGAVSLLRFDTFTRVIYTLYEGQIDRRPAAALSLLLMVVATAILLIERRTRTRAGYYLTRTKRQRRLTRLRSGGQTVSALFLSAYVAVALVVPVTVLAFWMRRSLSAGQDLGIVWSETFRSVSVAIVAAGVAALASLPVAIVTTWRRARFSTAAESATWAIYALPHVTVGVALVGFALEWFRPLYQTVGVLVLAYLSMFLAQSASSTQDALLRASPDLEEASRGLGVGPMGTLRRVILPIARPGLLAGSALVYLSVLKELPATLLLRPNGFDTLAIRIWSATGEGFFGRASAAGLALLAVAIVPLLVLTYRDFSN